MNQAIPSFQYFLKMQSRMAFFQKNATSYMLDDKTLAYEFCDKLNIRYPEILSNCVPFKDVVLEDEVIIKPKVGVQSKNIFKLVGGRAFELVNGNDYSYSELSNLIESRISSGGVHDEWIVERLVKDPITGGIPRDYKFYCFYGRVPLILETIREPVIQRCWYNSGNKIIKTGKYLGESFEGLGFDNDLLELAGKISLEIPSPFIRIDFISGDKNYLNEFTPKPSNCDGFTKGIDKLLGGELLKARGRLDNDLLLGKEFSNFKAIAYV